MSVRKASSALQMVTPVAPLVERETAALDSQQGSLDWQGRVRLAADRAAGIRTGLVERALVLGADHREGPHLERPETGRRLVAHIDALAEAGLSPAELHAFAEETDLENAGALWILTLLCGCLDVVDSENEFASWIDSLDPALFLDYERVLEVADALRLQPNPRLRQRARKWLDATGHSCAIALETASLNEISDEVLQRLSRHDDPFVQVALERLMARSVEPKSPLLHLSSSGTSAHGLA
jgi:hypothetical protein